MHGIFYHPSSQKRRSLSFKRYQLIIVSTFSLLALLARPSPEGELCWERAERAEQVVRISSAERINYQPVIRLHSSSRELRVKAVLLNLSCAMTTSSEPLELEEDTSSVKNPKATKKTPLLSKNPPSLFVFDSSSGAVLGHSKDGSSSSQDLASLALQVYAFGVFGQSFVGEIRSFGFFRMKQVLGKVTVVAYFSSSSSRSSSSLPILSAEEGDRMRSEEEDQLRENLIESGTKAVAREAELFFSGKKETSEVGNKGEGCRRARNRVLKEVAATVLEQVKSGAKKKTSTLGAKSGAKKKNTTVVNPKSLSEENNIEGNLNALVPSGVTEAASVGEKKPNFGWFWRVRWLFPRRKAT